MNQRGLGIDRAVDGKKVMGWEKKVGTRGMKGYVGSHHEQEKEQPAGRTSGLVHHENIGWRSSVPIWLTGGVGTCGISSKYRRGCEGNETRN